MLGAGLVLAAAAVWLVRTEWAGKLAERASVGVTPIRSGELLFAEDPAKKAVIAEPSTDSIDWDRTAGEPHGFRQLSL